MEFFKFRVMAAKLNKTNVCLVLKVEYRTAINDFRPISLCNFVYKIISKLLASRLKQLLSKMISPL